uniref:type I restriction endonuclease subunit R n=1 Tax=Prevotella sp. TaxID=59823 RepID=UPI003FF0D55A
MSDDNKFTEDAYEQTLIALFRDELGYQYELGYDVERDIREPFHRADLEASLRRLNPGLPDDVLAEGMKAIATIDEGTLEQNNETFIKWMQEGMEVELKQDGEERTVLMRLIDFDRPERNLFKVVNQWRVEEYKSKRCDIVVMVNGLPLVVVELKSAVAEDASIDDAYLQIRNYQQSIPSLFTYNAFNVISDMSETRAGTITAKMERYMEWKTVDGNYESTLVADYRTFFLGMFQKQRFADILQNYICFEHKEGKICKILAAYHQYFAVGKAMARTKAAVEGNGKIGVFWHTQGSGKSFSMVFYAHQLIQRLPEVTIVVVTDRKDLDNQLFGQFSRCTGFLRQQPVNATSRSMLGELLAGRKSGGIIFTTIQKFEEGDTALSTRRNIIVMTDEAHRSQYGDEHWDAQSQTMKKGFSQKMREALPNASFIGFTGTPISDRDRDTQEVFGSYIDVYDMSQAVDDEATRPIYYESRVVNLNLDEKTMKLLDEEFDHLSEEGATDEQIKKAKQEHSRLEVLLGEDATIDALVRDIIDHYEQNRAQLLTGKAMVVALTREIAIKIYRKMLELRPSWTEKVKVVMSGSNKDPEDWQKIIGNEAYKKELAAKFKKDDDPMKIAIVRDMWLTGFDVPSLATMYVYKPMSGHNLMQAIARVNRVFEANDGEKKEGGLIVDYVGIAQALKAAMKQYTNRDQRRFGDPDIAKTALLKWREEMEICRDQMHGFSYEGFFEDNNTKRAAAITGGANFLSAPDKQEKKKDFMEHSALLHNATTLCRSLLDEHERAEMCYMDALRVMLQKLSQKGKVSRHEINERIGQLLRQSVRSEGVINLFGDRQMEFSLFDEAFIKEIRNMKERNLAVELLTRLLREKIKKQQKTNVTQSDLFSDMLSQSLSRYLKGLLTNEEVIEELLRMAEQIKYSEEEGDKLGLTPEEKAFYDALSTPEGVRQAYTDEQFVALTKELTDVLHRNRTIDWNRKESARAKMRVMVKRLLKKYKYPPEGAAKALETVMRQCDHWADDDENVA